MPEKMHEMLARRAQELGLKGDRKNAYVFGTMHKVEKMRKKQPRKKKKG